MGAVVDSLEPEELSLIRFFYELDRETHCGPAPLGPQLVVFARLFDASLLRPRLAIADRRVFYVYVVLECAPVFKWG